MRASLLVTAVGALVVAGCAASPAHGAAGGAVAPPGVAPQAAPPGVAPQAAPPGDASRKRDEPSDDRVARQTHRALGWVILSVGAEAAVVATVTSFIMLHQNSLRGGDCTDKVCSPAGLSANETLRNLEWWNAGAWAVAVVGVGVGAVVLWTNPTDAALHAEVGIVPTGSGSGLRLRGTF